jgi:DNA polymerase IV
VASPGSRTILHVDMDAFYVSVELRRHPELVGRPVVVGGAGGRGVVAAASYEARRYGVHSAMPSVRARRLCPDAVFLQGDHELYASVSAEVRTIFDRYSPVVEPLSLDEAFLDVSGASRLFGDGVTIGHRVRADVRDELGLGCSVGVASNKFLAKLASVAAKPVATRGGVAAGPGVVAVEPGRELQFLHPLPVERLWGVGPATLERLDRLAVRTVGDLTHLDESILTATLGRAAGRHLRALSEGRDDRPVESDRRVKSIGHEETFASDLHTYDELYRELVRMADAVASRLRGSGRGARTLTLKVRFAGFRTITRSITGTDAVDTGPAITSALRPLLAEVDPAAGVRLLGVSSSNFASPSTQLSLLDGPADGGPGPAADPATDHLAAGAIDEIRERFGAGAIGPASAVDRRGLRVVRPGSQQWGPDDPPAR